MEKKGTSSTGKCERRTAHRLQQHPRGVFTSVSGLALPLQSFFLLGDRSAPVDDPSEAAPVLKIIEQYASDRTVNRQNGSLASRAENLERLRSSLGIV